VYTHNARKHFVIENNPSGMLDDSLTSKEDSKSLMKGESRSL
jgi:hypothetical protein